MIHEPHHVHHVLLVLSGDQEALDHQVHVQFEWLAVDFAPHDLDHLLGQLEVCSFEPQVAGWRYIKNEAEVNVYDIAFLFVYQNVSVVPVFYLQNV